MRLAFGVCALLVFGCSDGAKTGAKLPSDDSAVKDAFEKFQGALAKSDSDEMWKLVDEDTRQDADRAAQAAKKLHIKGTEAEKSALEMKLGLRNNEVEQLTGQRFLGSKIFADKYREIVGGKAEKVEFPKKGAAKLIYFDPSDNDREEVMFVQEQGAWKLRLKGMPRLEN